MNEQFLQFTMDKKRNKLTNLIKVSPKNYDDKKRKKRNNNNNTELQKSERYVIKIEGDKLTYSEYSTYIVDAKYDTTAVEQKLFWKIEHYTSG